MNPQKIFKVGATNFTIWVVKTGKEISSVPKKKIMFGENNFT